MIPDSAVGSTTLTKVSHFGTPSVCAASRICFSRPAFVASSVRTPRAPGTLKSVRVFRKVADLIERSPIAALWASPIAVSVPPKQTERVLTSVAR